MQPSSIFLGAVSIFLFSTPDRNLFRPSVLCFMNPVQSNGGPCICLAEATSYCALSGLQPFVGTELRRLGLCPDFVWFPRCWEVHVCAHKILIQKTIFKCYCKNNLKISSYFCLSKLSMFNALVSR